MVQDEVVKRWLFDNLQPYLTTSPNDVVMISSWFLDHDMQEGDIRENRIRESLKEPSNELDFYMFLTAKYLSSAFIASINLTIFDAALFDSRRFKQFGMEKKLQISMNRKNNLAEEILLKRLDSFQLERLLALLMITSRH